MLQLKDIVTLLNPLCGFASIVLSIQGQTYWAAGLIFVAYFFDAIDGSVAKLLGQSNRFGAELDNACDTFSFGIAPAILVYAVFRPYHPWLGYGLGFWLILCGIIRTARSNLTQASYEGYFLGLNRPVSAMLIAAMVNLTLFRRHDLIIPGTIFVVGMGLMNLTLIPYVNHRQTFPKWRKVLVYAATAITLIPSFLLGYPWEGLFVLLLLYTIHPLFITAGEKAKIRNYIRELKKAF